MQNAKAIQDCLALDGERAGAPVVVADTGHACVSHGEVLKYWCSSGACTSPSTSERVRAVGLLCYVLCVPGCVVRTHACVCVCVYVYMCTHA